LREHLGDALFERRGLDFVPTAEAERLAPVVRKALRSLEQSIGALDAFDPVASDRTFFLTMPDSLETPVLTALIRTVRENGYGVKFSVRPLFGVDPKEALMSRAADLVFLPHPMHDNHITSAYLFDEDACIICRADHPVLSQRDSFTLKDMATVGLVNLAEEVRRITHVEHEMRAKQINRNIVCTVSRLWSIPGIVATTDLCAAIPRTMAEDLAGRFNLAIFDLPLERPTHHWHMMWHEDQTDDPAHTWLRRQIQDIYNVR